MGKRTIGTGRGAVFIDGVRYDEGATVPDGANVGDHVFDDVDPVEGNVAFESVKPVTADSTTDSADAGPAGGTVDEVLGRVGDDPAAAQAALDAEQAKAKPRTSLVEKLQAIADGSGAGS